MRAIFTGTDHSNGFRAGQEYKIRTTIRNSVLFVIHERTICPYGSLDSLLRNWYIIQEEL